MRGSRAPGSRPASRSAAPRRVADLGDRGLDLAVLGLSCGGPLALVGRLLARPALEVGPGRGEVATGEGGRAERGQPVARAIEPFPGAGLRLARLLHGAAALRERAVGLLAPLARVVDRPVGGGDRRQRGLDRFGGWRLRQRLGRRLDFLLARLQLAVQALGGDMGLTVLRIGLTLGALGGVERGLRLLEILRPLGMRERADLGPADGAGVPHLQLGGECGALVGAGRLLQRLLLARHHALRGLERRLGVLLALARRLQPLGRLLELRDLLPAALVREQPVALRLGLGQLLARRQLGGELGFGLLDRFGRLLRRRLAVDHAPRQLEIGGGRGQRAELLGERRRGALLLHQLDAALAELADLRPLSIDGLRQPFELRDPRLRGVARFRCRVRETRVEPLLRALDPFLGALGPLRRGARHAAVDLELEQLHQQVLAIAGLVVEEARELALRQHDAAHEVLERKADEAIDPLVELAGAGGEDLGTLARGAPRWWWRRRTWCAARRAPRCRPGRRPRSRVGLSPAGAPA